MLAGTHKRVRAISLSSNTLINALSSRVNHLTSLLWEDDPWTMPSDELINATSRGHEHDPVRESPASSVRSETKNQSHSAIGHGRSYVQYHVQQAIVRSGTEECTGGSTKGAG